MTDAPAWQRWVPDATAGAVVLVLGIYEVLTSDRVYYGSIEGPQRTAAVLIVIAFAVAVGLSRRSPAAGLVIVWGTCTAQLLTGTSVLTVEFTVAAVAFGCARWGRVPTVLLSGLSIPVAATVGVLVVTQGSQGYFRSISVFRELMDSAYRFSDTLLVGAVILGLLTLAVPWLAGLVLRATARAQRSEVGQERAEADAARAQRESTQAREIAQLREDQTRLARDVHDVVGHSLAVILAQAESAQYLPDADATALKKTMQTIATTARSSLQDVRQVLAGPQDPSPAPSGAFEELLDGVRAGGHDVVATEVGARQPLPPELEVVAHRVVQEMLTNAIKHGRRDRPVQVERHWPEGSWDRDLRIEVRNVEVSDVGGAPDETQPIYAAAPPGQGLDGMRRRLDSVGGRLDVRRREEPDGSTFTATAWVPVRSGAR